MLFADRVDAGRRLAEAVGHLAVEDVVVLALPRGGVPVAYPVARALGAPLDVVVVRKLGMPSQPELALGAIGEGGVRVLNDRTAPLAAADELAEVERRERAELQRRARRFREGTEPVPVAGCTVIVVDDGIATGSTARAACQVVRAQGARRVVLAVPVAPDGVATWMRPDADEVVCLATPSGFRAIGQFYADFAQTSDEEVVELLRRSKEWQPTSPPTGGPSAGAVPPGHSGQVSMYAGTVAVSGKLTVPGDARGLVVFAHGSGSSRHSPRNRRVAAALNTAGLGTLLFDLLTTAEEADRANVFDIGLRGRRLIEVTDWIGAQPEYADLPIGYFGASTGAAAALTAAAEPRAKVAAIVSRGGRPDLAGPRLGSVHAPTLLIVGGDDYTVLDLNRAAQRQLHCENELAVVPGATHLFEEPGALEEVARLAVSWFGERLGRPAAATAAPPEPPSEPTAEPSSQPPSEPTADELRRRLDDLDAEIAELRGLAGQLDPGAVRDPEEIAADLTSRQEQLAVLAILERRREAVRERLARLAC